MRWPYFPLWIFLSFAACVPALGQAPEALPEEFIPEDAGDEEAEVRRALDEIAAADNLRGFWYLAGGLEKLEGGGDEEILRQPWAGMIRGGYWLPSYSLGLELFAGAAVSEGTVERRTRVTTPASGGVGVGGVAIGGTPARTTTRTDEVEYQPRLYGILAGASTTLLGDFYLFGKLGYGRASAGSVDDDEGIVYGIGMGAFRRNSRGPGLVELGIFEYPNASVSLGITLNYALRPR